MCKTVTVWGQNLRVGRIVDVATSAQNVVLKNKPCGTVDDQPVSVGFVMIAPVYVLVENDHEFEAAYQKYSLVKKVYHRWNTNPLG